MTPFEEFIAKGMTTQLNGIKTPYYKFQLACHKRDLSLWAKGMKPNKGFFVRDYKQYYGIKGNRQDVLKNFMIIFNKYMN